MGHSLSFKVRINDERLLKVFISIPHISKQIKQNSNKIRMDLHALRHLLRLFPNSWFDSKNPRYWADYRKIMNVPGDNDLSESVTRDT